MPPWSLRRSEKGSGDGLCPRGGDGRAAGLRAGAAGSLGLPTPSHRGHSQHPGLRAGGALPPLGGARQRPRSARWLRPRDWCPASRVASPPGHDGSRRPAGSSALGLWARPLPPGPLGAVRTSARSRFAPLCPRPAQSPAHLLGSGETDGRRWARGGHTHRGVGEKCVGGVGPQPGCGQAPEERGVAPSLGTSRRRRPSLGGGRPLTGRLWAADGGASFPSASRSQNASSARLRVPGWRFGGGRGALPQFPQARCFSMAPPPPWGPTPSLRSAGI